MLLTALLLSFSSSLSAGTLPGNLDQGYALYLQGDLQKAAELYRSAAQKGTAPASACLDGSVALQDLGRSREAVEMLQGCLRRDPEDPKLRSALAWAYYHEGDLAKAKSSFAETIKAGQADSFDTLGLAQVALEEKDYSRALDLLREVSGKRPRLPLVYYYQAKAHESRKELDEAISSYQRVIKEDSHFVEARPLLAALFEKQKQTDEAWKQYTKVTHVDPKNRKAQEKKEKLTPLLTKKPEEILPPKSIAKHTSVQPAPEWQKNPVLKIGIGTSSGGNIYPKKTVAFRAAAPFVLVDSSGKELAKGESDQTWVVRLDPHHPQSAEIVDPQGKAVASFQKSVRIKMESHERRTTIINALSYAPGYSWGGMADRELRGEVEVSLDPSRKTFLIVNHINVEEYLYGVLNSEMPTHWPMEALKAQAVLARTQAYYRRKVLRPHKAYGYDLCDEQHCQVYGGVAAETIRARTAVDANRGQILTYNGKPAHTIFFSNCGGHTQNGREIGWADAPYWQAVFDGEGPSMAPRSPWELKEWLKSEPKVYCNISKYIWSPEFRWTRVIPAEELESRVLRIKSIGRIRGITPLKRSRSGHVNALRIRGTSGNLVLEREHEIRRILGLGPLRSTLFVIETTYRKGGPRFFTLYGGGWGHGVGMCQAGAGGRAEAGAGYRNILSHYYPGTVLEPAAN